MTEQDWNRIAGLFLVALIVAFLAVPV